MPTYEFNCNHCKKRFELHATISEKEKGLKCPHCESSDLNQLFSNFTFFRSNGATSSCVASSCSTCNVSTCKR